MRVEPHLELPRHRPHRGGPIANTLGAQVIRTLVGHSLSGDGRAEPASRHQSSLRELGYAILPNVLSESASDRIQQYIRRIERTLDSPRRTSVRIDTTKLPFSPDHTPLGELLESAQIEDLTRWFFGRHVGQPPNCALWIQRHEADPESELPDSVRVLGDLGQELDSWFTRDRQDQWHADLSRPILKFFYYPFGSTESNMSLQYLARSHKLSAVKLREEYQSSIRSSKRRKAAKSDRSVRVCANPSLLEAAFDVVTFNELDPGTLVALNTAGYHRRHAIQGAQRTMMILSHKYSVGPLLWKR